MDSTGLMEFIKETSRGHRFNAEYSVTETQIQKAFKAFLDGRAPGYVLEEYDVLRSNIHEWDDYFWIDVTRNLKNGDQLRNLKIAAIQEFVNIFDQWQQSKYTFEEDVALEIKDAGRLQMQAYVNYLNGFLKGDVATILNPPVIHSLLTWFNPILRPKSNINRFVPSLLRNTLLTSPTNSFKRGCLQLSRTWSRGVHIVNEKRLWDASTASYTIWVILPPMLRTAMVSLWINLWHPWSPIRV